MFSARTLQNTAKRASRSSPSSFRSWMFTDSTLHRRLAGSVSWLFAVFLVSLFICSGTCMHIDGSTVQTWQYYWCSGRQGWAFDLTWFIDCLLVFSFDLELEISNMVLGFSLRFLLDAVMCYYPRPTIYLCTNSSTARTHPTDILLSTYPRNTNTHHATGHYNIVSYKHIPNKLSQPNQQALRYHTNTYIHRNIKRSSSETTTSPSY